MTPSLLQSNSKHNVRFIHSPQIGLENSHAFALAHNALVTALHQVRASEGNLLLAMANTRRALDAIQDMRQLIK